MKNTFYLLVCSLFLIACTKEATISSEILNIPVEAKIDRFDQEFMQTSPENFNTLKQKYPLLLNENVPDSVWFNKKKRHFIQRIV